MKQHEGKNDSPPTRFTPEEMINWIEGALQESSGGRVLRRGGTTLNKAPGRGDFAEMPPDFQVHYDKSIPEPVTPIEPPQRMFIWAGGGCYEVVLTQILSMNRVPQIERLKTNTDELLRFRGHGISLQGWVTTTRPSEKNNYRHVASWKCAACGMRAQVDTRPEPNGTVAGGDAIALKCTTESNV